MFKFTFLIIFTTYSSFLAACKASETEIDAHYEVYSYLHDANFSVIRTDSNDYAMIIGVQAEEAFFVSEILQSSWTPSVALLGSSVFSTSASIGKRWDELELFIGYKIFVGTNMNYEVGTVKIGLRYPVWENLLIALEAGETHHLLEGDDWKRLPEVALGMAYRF
jgi:hypothetical protein